MQDTVKKINKTELQKLRHLLMGKAFLWEKLSQLAEENLTETTNLTDIIDTLETIELNFGPIYQLASNLKHNLKEG
jgi:hypothetical protein